MSARISRILLPTKFAILSKRAAEYVSLLAPALDAQLHVVHVVPHTEIVVDAGVPGVALPIIGPSTTELLEQAQRKLQDFVTEVIPQLESRTTTFAVCGGITAELIKCTHTHQIDLGIMGTHADGMLKRLVFGSVGKGVVEGASCPVLLVPVHGQPH